MDKKTFFLRTLLYKSEGVSEAEGVTNVVGHSN